MTCKLCPRNCDANRTDRLGYCGSAAEPEAVSICIHKGEEPPISGRRGICNVFFAHCNLQCVYCQNNDISGRHVDAALVRYRGVEQIVRGIEAVLPECENMVGFVTPTHYAASIPAIVERLHADGYAPTVVYNTGGYDSVETLRMVEPYVDIYLPDLKYLDAELAAAYSHAADYPQRATLAIAEMYRQKGASLMCDDGLAFRGLIIRHLVLPGAVDNSLKVLDWIADNLPQKTHISLMAQYFPPEKATLPDALRRTITKEEYDTVVRHYQEIGFYNGWVQELAASLSYRPDFSNNQAFDK